MGTYKVNRMQIQMLSARYEEGAVNGSARVHKSMDLRADSFLRRLGFNGAVQSESDRTYKCFPQAQEMERCKRAAYVRNTWICDPISFCASLH